MKHASTSPARPLRLRNARGWRSWGARLRLALCRERRCVLCDTKTKPQPRRAIRARLFDLCSQRGPVTHASRSQHVRSPPPLHCAVPCGQKRLFLKNLGRGLAGCNAFQHALCMCRECQSACLAPFLRAWPIAESGLPQCAHTRFGSLGGGGHCDCIAVVCSVDYTRALHLPEVLDHGDRSCQCRRIARAVASVGGDEHWTCMSGGTYAALLYIFSFLGNKKIEKVARCFASPLGNAL